MGIVACSGGHSFSAPYKNGDGQLQSDSLVTILWLFIASYGVSQLLIYEIFITSATFTSPSAIRARSALSGLQTHFRLLV